VFSSNTCHGQRNLNHNKRLLHYKGTRAKDGKAVTNVAFSVVVIVERFE
jgi:hypothetical protein